MRLVIEIKAAIVPLFILAVLALHSTSCAEGSGEEIDVSIDGREVTVLLSEETVDDERVLIVDHLAAGGSRKESDVEAEVLAIWKAAEKEADRRGIRNGLIKFRLPLEDGEDGGPGKYEGLLFEAEKIENGTWKLRKVN